ncbi:EscC/YscC/HrcC family type III secretion system outer membrane ring protein [Duganella sp. BJB488]|uniref:type III secretion system outer membrane ring subunit SctC n=1 Tax=unclassified Duganella TaxID=2636909 RepID=UPI000E345765|nr:MULTISPECIES: type III secretion system outer membrane ring subunit SctC [unclassified Duganella]RFP09338.1 EscC/YscC/HrcC family type III secretion system outer membrane ring protein [Duganella sp. BJB475]RFP13226.1 EscC/YscC/HrcC family type III secretion system outer membrane ring protein [Duganella sp. BJB489]RFP17199.1 EscC/YscC/HrcC family type III secretion system outer membrane ring protein [Duganella sp. BJB488]RFP25374.1 EscC/YscC/HrcC family type III secretion system outer membran
MIPAVFSLRLPRALLCAALLASCAGAGAATAIPWRTRTLQYAADRKDVKDILRELAASQGVMTWISPQVEGSVSGKFSESPQHFLDRLAASFGFVWYYDGAVLRISGANEAKSATIGLNYVSASQLRRAVQRLHVDDPRFPIQYDDEARAALVSGPPRYVELVGEIAARIDRAAEGQPRTEVRLFPLRYGWAADHPLRLDGQTVTLPGIASVLRSMYQNNEKAGAAARTQSAAPAGAVNKLSAMTPLAGGNGPGPAQGGADGQGLKPPLPRGMAAGADSGAAPLPSAGDSGADGSGASRAGAEQGPVIQPDPRSNAVLIRDLPERMAAYGQLIAALDTRPQVLEISASIIDITETGLEQLGIDWRVHTGHLDFETGNGQLAQASQGTSLDPAGFANPAAASGTAATTPTGATLTAVLGGAGRYLLARVSALEQTSQAHITATPKVATLDNVEAVMDNKKTFYVPVSGFQAADLYSVSAGVALRVLPLMVNDEHGSQIRLSVHIDDGQLTSQLVGQLPVVSNSTIDTQAMIRMGESLLIAGYAVEQNDKEDSGVPWLSGLPVIGNLFKFKQRQTQKVQRLFLLTPRLITPS